MSTPQAQRTRADGPCSSGRSGGPCSGGRSSDPCSSGRSGDPFSSGRADGPCSSGRSGGPCSTGRESGRQHVPILAPVAHDGRVARDLHPARAVDIEQMLQRRRRAPQLMKP